MVLMAIKKNTTTTLKTSLKKEEKYAKTDLATKKKTNETHVQKRGKTKRTNTSEDSRKNHAINMPKTKICNRRKQAQKFMKKEGNQRQNGDNK